MCGWDGMVISNGFMIMFYMGKNHIMTKFPRFNAKYIDLMRHSFVSRTWKKVSDISEDKCG
jgi:hypothetical protein